MNFGYFGECFSGILVYHYPPPPHPANPEDNGGQNSTDFYIRFIAACTVKVIFFFFRLETEKAAMQTDLEDTKSQLESFKRY